MIIRYFLKNFAYQGLILLSIFTMLFASCNVLMRLPFIHTISVIPYFVVAMLPLMGLFAFPIAASLSVCMVFVNHASNNELLVISLVKKARQALTRSVILFSITSGLCYMFLVFQLAPQSYQVGKRILLHAAREHVLALAPHKFHTPFPSFTFYFKDKYSDEYDTTIFSTLLLAFYSKKTPNEYYFFSAQDGFFKDNHFILRHGVLHFLQKGTLHSASFEQTEINADMFVADTDDRGGEPIQPKFLTYEKLLLLLSSSPEAFIELHKRIAQVLWSCAQPIILFFICSIMSGVSLLQSVSLGGFLYLLSYILVVFAQVFHTQPYVALFLFYIPIIIFFLFAWYFYRRCQK